MQLMAMVQQTRIDIVPSDHRHMRSNRQPLAASQPVLKLNIKQEARIKLLELPPAPPHYHLQIPMSRNHRLQTS